MHKLLHVVIGLAGFMFVFLGAGWLFAPAVISPQLGMSLQSGVGLSTQIGDLSAFFLTLGACILLGLYTGKRYWFLPPMMLLGLAAMGRMIAWLFHDAALALDMIGVEVLVASLLLVTSGRLTTSRPTRL